MPKVTVCIPVYNGSKYISKTIDSILNSTFTDFELLICDNASTDNLKDIVNNINDSRLKYIRFDDYMDVNYSFIRALRMAKSEFICLYHSDDWYYPDIIQYELGLLESNPHCGAVTTSMKSVTNDNYDIVYTPIADVDIKVYSYEHYLLEALNNGTIFSCPTVMYRRKYLLLSGLLDRKDGLISDMSLWLAIIKVSDIIKSSYIGVNYRRTEQQLSSKIFNKRLDVLSPQYILLDHELKKMPFAKRLQMLLTKNFIYYYKRRIIALIKLLLHGVITKKCFFQLLLRCTTIDDFAFSEKEYLKKLYRL